MVVLKRTGGKIDPILVPDPARVAEMLAERGVNVDHSTIYRWVQRYAPEMENGCAGTGVTLPIFARGTWMKPT